MVGLRAIALGAAVTLGLLASASAPAEAFQWNLPRGFPKPFVPADNPMTTAKVALGRELFFDPRLSINGTHSCASCHDPARAFADSRRLSIGALSDLTRTNAMSLTNVAYNVSFGWTKANVHSLEEQMLEPMLNEHPVELGLKGREEKLVAELTADAAMRERFITAFPEANGRFTLEHIIKSIATFERTLVSGNSAFDRYVFQGDHKALTEEAKRGMALFYSERLGCGACHAGFNFAGAWRDDQGATAEPSFANNGIGNEPVRVPTLRNIAATAPYMHDGSLSTLEAVLAHYEHTGRRLGAAAVHAKKSNDPAPQPALRAFTLTAAERHELIAFLQSLTDPTFGAGLHGERTNSVSGR